MCAQAAYLVNSTNMLQKTPVPIQPQSQQWMARSWEAGQAGVHYRMFVSVPKSGADQEVRLWAHKTRLQTFRLHAAPSLQQHTTLMSCKLLRDTYIAQASGTTAMAH
ncbi:TPA: hypothetical protein ACH3X1_015056 [Trebouxia sp. C0004]